jgi:hypothetical protein
MSEDARETFLELLYPFYLDTEMSMSFSAALTGGVALEEEQLDRAAEASEAVKNLRGNLRLWRAGGFDAGSERSNRSELASESRLIRHHTVASIFIDLFSELRRTGRLREEPAVEEVQIGDIVAMRMGPAVAPLRRVVDQVGRLLDIMVPVLDDDGDAAVVAGSEQDSRQQRRARERAAARRSQENEPDDGLRELRQLRRLFVAIRDDLDHSGMIDIAVAQEDAPSAVLTLDKRFVSAPTLELLHTSSFVVVGKVTQIWSEPEDIVNLYRRSVLSLVPSLAQSTVWGVFAFLGTLSMSLDVKAMEQAAWRSIGKESDTPEADADEEVTEASSDTVGGADAEPQNGDASASDDESGDDVMLGEDIAALTPIVNGPALQILPLAICS